MVTVEIVVRVPAQWRVSTRIARHLRAVHRVTRKAAQVASLECPSCRCLSKNSAAFLREQAWAAARQVVGDPVVALAVRFASAAVLVDLANERVLAIPVTVLHVQRATAKPDPASLATACLYAIAAVTIAAVVAVVC